MAVSDWLIAATRPPSERDGPRVHPLAPGDLLEGPAARRQPVEVLLPGMLAAGGDEERVAARRELGAPHLERHPR